VAYSIMIAPEDYDKDLPLFVAIKENRLLNEFFLFVLEDLHTSQGLGALKFTSDDPEFVKDTVEHVYAAIPATPTAPLIPPTRAFSWQLVAYIAAFLPTAPYFKSSDSRISAVCDDQYSSTLAMLEETADETLKAYMTRKTQGWFRRWGCDASASPGSGRVERRGRISPHHADGPGGGRRKSCAIANPGHGQDAGGIGHTPSKTSRLQPSPLLSSAKLAYAGGYTHIEIFHDSISETV
jgi:hypothetical protein